MTSVPARIRSADKPDFVGRDRHTFFSPFAPIVEMNAIGRGVWAISWQPRLGSEALTMAEIMNWWISHQ